MDDVKDEQQAVSSGANPRISYRVLKVGRRTYRKRSQQDRRRILAYQAPELRLSNNWLRAAGIEIGDRVAVSNFRDGSLLVMRMPRRSKPHA